MTGGTTPLSLGYALVIGAGRYARLPDVPAVSTTVQALREVLVKHAGFAAGAVRVIENARSVPDLGRAIVEAAERADGKPLLIYFVGHGLVGSRGELYLALPGTDSRPGLIEFSALAYESVRRTLLGSNATPPVVILDCCFSSRAVPTLSAGDLADRADVDGAFVLASSGREEVSLAPKGAALTTFSGRLIELIEHGDRDSPAELTLARAAQVLKRRMTARGEPVPHSHDNGSGALVLAGNPAAGLDPSERIVHPPRRRLPRWRIAAASTALVAAAGLTMLLTHLSGRDAAKNTGSTSPPTASAAAATAVVPVGGLVIDSPVAGARLSQCVTVSGRSRLPAGKTIILAVRDLGGATTLSFQLTDDWDNPARLATWQGTQFLGSGSHGVGQPFEITAVIADLTKVRALHDAALAKGSWTADSLAGIGVAGDSVTVARAPAGC